MMSAARWEVGEGISAAFLKVWANEWWVWPAIADPALEEGCMPDSQRAGQAGQAQVRKETGSLRRDSHKVPAVLLLLQKTEIPRGISGTESWCGRALELHTLR